MNQETSRCPAQLLIVNDVPTLRGEIDLLCVPELERWLDELNGRAVAVDLSEVTFFDSSALRTFLGARRRNHTLRIARPSKAVERVLEITDTTDYLVHGRDIVW